MARTRVFKALLASACCAALAPAALAKDSDPAEAAGAAKAAVEAAQAAAAALPSTPAVPTPPPAPIAPPVLNFAAADGEAAQDLLGSTAAMPVASAKLLARLTGEPAAPAVPTMPPVFAAAPVLAAAETAPTPSEPLPAAPLPAAPLAPPRLLASLGAAPVTLPSAAALEAAVAAQTTPIPAPRADRPAPAPAPRMDYAAASFSPPRPRRRAASASNARFLRAVASPAVISTAAVSVEMPDVARQISPFGLLLGQLASAQETPGSQYGLAEEMAMPTRPRLIPMPEVAVPPSFCSAQQRGAFMEGIYQPAMAIAQHNSDVAGAYVRKLRTLYDNTQLSGDARAEAAIAAEAKDFARTANAVGRVQDDLSGQFEAIMSTPVTSCGASQ